jgi:hypothetical protein
VFFFSIEGRKMFGRFVAAGAVILSLICNCFGADDGSAKILTVNPQVWVIDQEAFHNATAMKTITWPEDALVDIGSRPKTAIAFSGGGTRSAIASFGYLRSLMDLGVLDSVKYIAGISGGAWATTAFTYFQHKYTDSIAKLLGEIIMPTNLTMDALKNIETGCIRRAPVDNNLIDVSLKLLTQKNESLSQIWRDAVYEVFLEPAGVPKNALLTWNTGTRDAILQRNPDLVKANVSWSMPCGGDCNTSIIGRPFPLIGSTLLGPTNLVPLNIKKRSYTQLELTPLYVGEAIIQNVTFYGHKGQQETMLLGGLMDTFALGSTGPKNSLADGVLEGVLYNATLFGNDTGTTAEDIAGMSSWALADFVSTLLPEVKALDITMPYWVPLSSMHTGLAQSSPPTNTQTNFGDGGCSDNLNLASVLHRGVKSIVLFYTANQPLSPSDKWNPFKQTNAKDIRNNVDTQFPAYFGKDVDPGNGSTIGWDYSRDHLFAWKDFAPTIAALQKVWGMQKTMMIDTGDFVIHSSFVRVSWNIKGSANR